MKAPFGRIGGKSKLAKQIIELIPKDYKIYCEPFVGAGSVFFRKQKTPTEVINDIDEDIYTVLKLFSEVHGPEISQMINGIYTKEQFQQLLQSSNPQSFEEKAYKKLTLFKTSFLSKGRSYAVSKKKLKTKYDDMYFNRLKDVTILNKDYKEIIDLYDSTETFFYFDPPYENTKEYKTQINPMELYNILRNIKGMFILSYNDSPTIREIFKDFEIKSVSTKYAVNINKIISELLIYNFKI